MRSTIIANVVVLVGLMYGPCYGFLAVSKSVPQSPSSWVVARQKRLLNSGTTQQQQFLVDEGSSEDLMIMGNSELDSAMYSKDKKTSDESSFFQELEKRKKAIKNGIGKRYVTRTRQGFLNIHYEPTDPFHTDNVVGQLQEGQIVMSTGPTRGFWIPHDGGGWSISKHGGFTWLEPIDE